LIEFGVDGFPNIPFGVSEGIGGLHNQAGSQEKVRGASNAVQSITAKNRRNGGQQGAEIFCAKGL
jgi:hypothetical protein